MVYYTDDYMNFLWPFILEQYEKATPIFPPEATNTANFQNIFCLEYRTMGSPETK